ncbi:MAG: glycosyltransferase family 1 protein [Oscillospiraceae bacterium]
MKIILNAIQFKQQSSGIGLMIYNLYKNLIEVSPEIDFTILLSKDSPILVDEEKYNVIRTPFEKGQVLLRNLYENFVIGKYANNSLYLSCDSKLPLFMPKLSKKILFVTDLAVYRMGDVYQASRKLYWKYMFKRSIKKADKVIAISEFTKSEIIEILGTDSNKIEVVYCAANENISHVDEASKLEFVKQKYNLPDNFLLFVGNFNPRKNLINIIKAFDKFKQINTSNYKLVIVGENGWKFNGQEALADIVHKEDILFPGYVDDADLSAVYTLSDMFLFPTLYEGFGIPIIEAQLCKTPVIASNTSCFKEVAGDGAILVNPYSVEEISEAILAVCSDNALKEDLIKKGIDNCCKFSWKKSAEELKTIILECG